MERAFNGCLCCNAQAHKVNPFVNTTHIYVLLNNYMFKSFGSLDWF